MFSAARALTQDGPIPNANIGARVIDPRQATLGVTEAFTDGGGRVRLFIPMNWADYPPNADILVKVRLSPTMASGPKSVKIPIQS